MCFSAPASFAASGVLAVAGWTTLKKARPHERLIALVPIVFALQQACEGFVWLTIMNGKPALAAAYGFLFFSNILWPVYVPVAMYVLEKRTRKIMRWFIGLGSIVSLNALIGLIIHPLHVMMIHSSISYGAQFPFAGPAGWLYFIVIFGSLFVSRNRFLRLFALLSLLSAIIAGIFFYLTFTSVWCFFAAVTSILIVVYLHQEHPAG